jgi:hypothetical protein
VFFFNNYSAVGSDTMMLRLVITRSQLKIWLAVPSLSLTVVSLVP